MGVTDSKMSTVVDNWQCAQRKRTGITDSKMSTVVDINGIILLWCNR